MSVCYQYRLLGHGSHVEFRDVISRNECRSGTTGRTAIHVKITQQQ